MNVRRLDILHILLKQSYINQRELAEVTGCSLGVVNQSLKALVKEGYLTEEYALTKKALIEKENSTPENAIILAAGFGMRMIPINSEIPKGMLIVKGEVLIERIIKQLQEVGINKIYVVVGFMKESFEYLIDKFHVELIVNPEYADKNNLFSLKRAIDRIHNTYVIPCDVYAVKNPFRECELYSWYMVGKDKDPNSDMKITRNRELIKAASNEEGNQMIGISYIHRRDAELLKKRMMKLSENKNANELFWETALIEKRKSMILGRLVPSDDYYEINTYEQLRNIDSDLNQLKSDALDVIAKVFDTPVDRITNIEVLKKGMTNRSFLFDVSGHKYIMRIPGEGTDRLIDRKNEADVYQTISGKGLCDDVIYINPENGYKITRYLENVRVCNAEDEKDLKCCMRLLRHFHNMKMSVPNEFDIFGKIEMYEGLWDGRVSVYPDYLQTKKNVYELKEFIETLSKDWALTHIDAVPDNFLFYTAEHGDEKLQLTDWEYAGMQDPHVDIAMFCIYALYSKKQVDHLIDIYFENECSLDIRSKIYAYIAACGLLWSNWCEYKRILGVEFGEYSLRQYRFAKDYYHYAKEGIQRINRS